MTDANNMRKFMILLEKASTEYEGPIKHPDISYKAHESGGKISKVVANLQSYESGRYTKLGRNLLRIERIETRIKQLKEEVKSDTKELVADLFHASDAAHTRVVDTVGFTFTLSKDPNPAETKKYAKILEELQEHLTPELLKVLKQIESKYTTFVQKSPSLKAVDKKDQPTEESINEGIGDKLKSFFNKFLNAIKNWANNYDAKLDALKAQAGVTESVSETENLESNTLFKEIADYLGLKLDEKLVDAIQFSAVTQTDWDDDKDDVADRVYSIYSSSDLPESNN